MNMKRTVLSAFLFAATALAADAQLPDGVYERLPFTMKKVECPVFRNARYDIRDYGAVADGKTLCTRAINDAIRKASADGGGTVVVPSGMWLTGPVVMLSNVNLHLEDNAFVLFSPDHEQYPVVKTTFEGLDTYRCQALISADGAVNVAITGRGVIDGNGETWRPLKKSKVTDSKWKRTLASGGVTNEAKTTWYPSVAARDGQKMCTDQNVPGGISDMKQWEAIRDWLRPVLLDFSKCRNVMFSDVTFRNSPSWCLHPVMCENVVVDGISVFNPSYAQNGDAIDLESCTNALVCNSTFSAGDDCICIKSGKDADGRRRGMPCQNVVCVNNTVYDGHGGFVVGSEMSGGVKNIYVDNCTFIGTDVGIRFKSTRGRGGVVENIHVGNVNMQGIGNEAVLFDLYYGGKLSTMNEVHPVSVETPAFRNIHISDIVVSGCGKGLYFNGLPEMKIDNVHMKNVMITGATDGGVIRNSKNVTLDNVRTYNKAGKLELKLHLSDAVTIDGKKYKKVGSEILNVY